MERIFLHQYDKQVRTWALRVKNAADAVAREHVATEMAKHVTPGSILVPVPSSSGLGSAIPLLAQDIAMCIPGSEVIEAVIRKTPVMSSFKCRRMGVPPPTLAEHIASMKFVEDVPGNGMVYIIDNVIVTGHTIGAVLHHLPVPRRRITLLVYADATAYRPAIKNPPQVRCCICGSRGFNDESKIKKVLQTLPPGYVVVHGGARGADSIAGRLAAQMGFEVDAWPADWERHGRAAGPIRNEAMIKTCDELIAFWDGKSRGTMHAIGVAYQLQLETEVFL